MSPSLTFGGILYPDDFHGLTGLGHFRQLPVEGRNKGGPTAGEMQGVGEVHTWDMPVEAKGQITKQSQITSK